VPRGKALFSATSPNNEVWPTDPEEALRLIAESRNATYIKGSLVFAPGGRVAEALFETKEPGHEDGPSDLFALAEDLDAREFRLYVDVDRWKSRREGGG
jgi:hypothetical protein